MKPKNIDKFFLKRLVVGPLEVNCYILADPVTKEACLIDPGADPERIKKLLRENNFKINFIINTHGHGDHIAANACFAAPIYIHKLDEDFLMDPKKNLSEAFLFNISSPKAAKTLEEGNKISLGALKLEIIHTPGHTPGSISIKLDGIVFTGDALFSGGIGRTDFDYGNEKTLLRSIRNKLLILADDTVIYPGHGNPSTIGEERRTNPFLI